jgi:hypothetical protein
MGQSPRPAGGAQSTLSWLAIGYRPRVPGEARERVGRGAKQNM